MGISPLRQAERTFLADGTISKDEAAQLAKLAKAKGADPVEVKQMLEHDAFASGARETLSKVLPKPPQDTSLFAGTRVGTNRYGEDVRVTRELGSVKGYDDRLQAIAVARMAKAEPAAVLQGTDGKWHAVETTANFFGGGTAADGPTRAVFGLASRADMDALEQELQATNKALKGLSSQSPEFKTLTTKRAELREKMAQVVFGVGKEEVNEVATSTSRKADVINVNQELAKPSSRVDGLHGPVGARDGDFDPSRETAIEVSASTLDTPSRAQSVLFHEASHRDDTDLARTWVQKYEKSGHTFVSSQTGPFKEWLAKQQLSPANRELAYSVVNQDGAQSEARAHVHAFLAALDAGAPEAAAAQLKGYAAGLASKQDPIASLPTGSEVEKALTAELKAAWKDMSAEQRAQFKAAVAQAKAANPSAWVSRLDLKD